MRDVEQKEHVAGGPACALSPSGLTDRIAEWKRIAAQAQSRTAGPGWISSTYPRSALSTLRSLIEAEAECCPFLSFEVRERGGVIDVRLRFPAGFEAMIAAVTAGESSKG